MKIEIVCGGYKTWEYYNNFIPLEEWREQQLNKLIK